MAENVAYFESMDKTWLPAAGGKGANLCELTRAGFPVPPGFCITTAAYKTFIQTSGEMAGLLDQLDLVSPEDLGQIQELGHRIREHLRSLEMPEAIRSDILQALRKTGEDRAYAVRSSATAEDLPTASFAGQQDTYLNVRGKEQLLRAVQNCWASLFTDRAIAYRAKNGFGHRSVLLSVVVQQMVFPEISGIMFTADPVTGHRKTLVIDASFGLGEALVSGIVSADLYKVRAGEIVEKRISTKKLAIYASPDGGTIKQEITPERQEAQALPDAGILELAAIGEKIEAHYGSEQDIEWCLAGGQFYVLQSRPVTSLYPVPRADDSRLHVFVSFGHFQMMTEAMRPLTLSIWKTCMGPGSGLMADAGSRLFIDPTRLLAIKPARKVVPRIMSVMMDESIAAAFTDLTAREDFRQDWDRDGRKVPVRLLLKVAPIAVPALCKALFNLVAADPAKVREDIAARLLRFQTAQEKAIREASGPERVRRIQEGLQRMLPSLFPTFAPGLAPAILSSKVLDSILRRQLGEERGTRLMGQLFKSLPGSITTELGLAVGDLADTVTEYPGLAKYLREAKDETFYAGLEHIAGGPEFRRELGQFMARFGMRCSGEVDITAPRWKESPTALLPVVLSQAGAAPGEHRRKHQEGRLEAERATAEILDGVRKTRLGFLKAGVLARLIRVYRNIMGLREYPKHIMMLHLEVCKQALLEEAKTLVAGGSLQNEQDIFYLSLDEILALEDGRLAGDARDLVAARKRQYELDRKLSPPRVVTSEGEVITGKRQDTGAPSGALIGTPASAGTVEGTARVILRLEDARLSPGEILVAPYTDPGWTPLFSSARGLVTEVGGMMTHGSVVAREYGIPAVVGVEGATRLIKDGSRIRVDGTRGYVQVLKERDFD
ncbi:phosphoenolpyruvate synthase [Methanocella arvoryzae]|uniref:Probable phosphoenolpyruvate synthase n=1 Tax=Methanocella arvoryzae (strain DSM 22066 / NBRC 105507 / MRE50) TaxID=351160 RepID=Q0W544_METAR|nr:phosphoenolpyruvate synthase [Methanocella arvoryzae]CAJ36499.1 phosphoenolpyruvate synthetase (PEP synthase) [Methanocella arvoryzae MRE50]